MFLNKTVKLPSTTSFHLEISRLAHAWSAALVADEPILEKVVFPTADIDRPSPALPAQQAQNACERERLIPDWLGKV